MSRRFDFDLYFASLRCGKVVSLLVLGPIFFRVDCWSWEFARTR